MKKPIKLKGKVKTSDRVKAKHLSRKPVKKYKPCPPSLQPKKYVLFGFPEDWSERYSVVGYVGCNLEIVEDMKDARVFTTLDYGKIGLENLTCLLSEKLRWVLHPVSVLIDDSK